MEGNVPANKINTKNRLLKLTNRKRVLFFFKFLFIACLIWIILYIIYNPDYYSGEPLTKARLVIINKLKFYSGAPDQSSYYFFTAQRYNCEFRISEGALNVVKDNSDSKNSIAHMDIYDTIDVEFKKSEVKKLHETHGNIHIVGLSVKNKPVIDPVKVALADRKSRYTNIFCLVIFSLIFIGWQTRKYFKVKDKS